MLLHLICYSSSVPSIDLPITREIKVPRCETSQNFIRRCLFVFVYWLISIAAQLSQCLWAAYSSNGYTLSPAGTTTFAVAALWMAWRGSQSCLVVADELTSRAGSKTLRKKTLMLIAMLGAWGRIRRRVVYALQPLLKATKLRRIRGPEGWAADKPGPALEPVRNRMFSSPINLWLFAVRWVKDPWERRNKRTLSKILHSQEQY